MVKKIISSLGVGAFIWAVAFALALPVHAADEIDVEYPVGTNINGDDIFDEEDIYPGWSESKTIRVENQSTTDDTNLYFTFDVNGDKKLAEKLKLYVVRVADNSYRIGGAGDRWDLEAADDENLYVDKLSVGEDERYKIKIKFDETAGNEYQGLETDLDIDFTIESENSGAGTEGDILAAQGRTDFSGNPPAEEVLGESTADENKEGTGASEEVAGEAINGCVSWPLWAWILALVVYGGAFNWRSFANLKAQRQMRFAWQIVFTLGAVALWYFFDSCRIYNWFPIIAVLGGAASFWYYIYRFGRVKHIA